MATLVEVGLLRVGMATAKAAARLWLKDNAIGTAASSSLIDAFGDRIGNLFDRRRAGRGFDVFAEHVAEKLQPYLDSEFGGIHENERGAALELAAAVLEKTEFSQKALFATDLDPSLLENDIRRQSPDATVRALLDPAGTSLFDFVLGEACNYIVEANVALPPFTSRAAVELLRRDTEILALLRDVLNRLPESPPGNKTVAATFEVQYLRAVARRLDRLELFGVTASEISRRYPLSVAYITLTASSDPSSRALSDKDTSRRSEEEDAALGNLGPDSQEEAYVRVDEALANRQRVLIRGEAGSGKTTLLQWLAVSSARRTFVGPLTELNETIPFFLQLRRYVGTTLPRPEEFVAPTAPNLVALMPEGWVHEALVAGRAMVLIDGLDELPESQRRAAREWLLDLCDTFPESTFLISSRPPAAHPNWLTTDGFASTELQPMGLADIDAFIDQWHQAARADAAEADQAELELLGAKLRSIVREVPPVRSLATSPLLCAMLCALNRDRRAQLPKDRLELYRIALEMLLERRDIERELAHENEPRLSLPEKLILFQALSLWLLMNGLSDCSVEQATERIATQLAAMPQVESTPQAIFRYLLLRSGLLREPVEGRVDFVHRTFQEYLGARQVIDDDLIGMLVDRATEDQWREVIVLASGHASMRQRQLLLSGLLERGHQDANHRHRLHLLAVACLETSRSLDPELRTKLQECLESLMPPTNMTEARAVASAGESAVSLLTEFRDSKATIAASCVRALSLIGTDAAFEALTRFGSDSRVTVSRELIRAWRMFDTEEYAREVLAKSPLDGGALHVREPALLAAAAELPALERLQCAFSRKLQSLEPLAGVSHLVTHLDIRSCQDISDFRKLTHMRSLSVLDAAHTKLDTLLYLRDVPLRSLIIDDTRVTSLEGVQDCASLRFLSARRLRVDDLSPLANLEALSSLYVSQTHVSDLGPVQHLGGLRTLHASYTPIDSIEALSGLGALRWVDLSSTGIQDLAGLTAHEDLNHLYVRHCARLVSLAPLAVCQNLSTIHCLGSPIADIEVVGTLERVRSLDLEGTAVTSIGPLADHPRLEWLDLRHLPQQIDLAPLCTLAQLRQVYLDAAEEPPDLRPLLEANPHVRVNVGFGRFDFELPPSIRRRVRCYFDPMLARGGAGVYYRPRMPSLYDAGLR